MAPIASQILLATLTGSALAAVQVHQRHGDLHKRYAGSSVAVPYGSNSTGIYPTGSGTVGNHIVTKHTTATKVVTEFQTGAAASNSAPPVPQYEQKGVAAPGSNNGATCPSVVTVTVTATAPTVADASTPTASSTTPALSSTSAVVAQPAQKEVQHSRYGGRGKQSSTTSFQNAAAASSTTSQQAPAPPATSQQAAAPTTTQQQAPAPYSQPAVSSSTTPTAYSSSAPSSTVAASQPSSPAVCKRATSAKKGCVATKGARNNCETLNSAGAGMSWIYDWEAAESDLGGMEYVPMLHGVDGDWMKWFKESAAAKTAKFVMLPNEPMISGQSAAGRTVTQGEVEAIYQDFKGAISDKATILSPSICGNQMGIDWLKAFNSEYYQVVNAHYYEDCTSEQGSAGLNKFLDGIKTAMPGKHIWVTELGCHPNGASQSQIQDFMKSSVATVESDAMIDRYSWFMADSTGDMTQGWLMNGNSPSVYGQQYSSAGCA